MIEYNCNQVIRAEPFNPQISSQLSNFFAVFLNYLPASSYLH